MKTFLLQRVCTIAAVCVILPALHSRCLADVGDPVAIRAWSDGCLSVESLWNLNVVLLPAGRTDEDAPSGNFGGSSRDIVKGTSPLADNERTIDVLVGKSADTKLPETALRIQNLSDTPVVIDFPATADSPTLLSGSSADGSPNAIALKRFSIAGESVTATVVDGLSILDLRQIEDLGKVLGARTASIDIDSDSAIVVVMQGRTLDSTTGDLLNDALPANSIVQVLLVPDADGVNASEEIVVKAFPDCQVTIAKGNTAAVSKTQSLPEVLDVVLLSHQPYVMSAELAELYEAKEKACRESQAVFATLSAEQLNFAPANGTHTPRWNAEHMMGRELVFFGQIFGEIDSTIGSKNLNPKQNPPDYEAAHPDWNGRAEAKQMERVSAFTRRFAYLLDDLDLDEKAPGSFWTLRRLLIQMDKHYGQHTANVKKKFELEGWPSEANP
jgi:hypothetical protein